MRSFDLTPTQFDLAGVEPIDADGASLLPGGVALDSVRAFCRKRRVRFEPGPWRYHGGLI